ncbi:hypothetical protein [Bacteroides ovatus]|jgi:hypothetical protein|uniref:hypothetical protein n=1 Tax=Bacteroides ovatus TaxID=28116 RepID=UPI001C8B78D6|nr:hypothetical protein [Bacteroides ovatus]
MKKLTSILKNQTIRIDNHDSGTGRPFEWGTGVHIHKILNEKKYKGTEFILPLDRPGEIKYIRGYDISGNIESEIRKAFKDEDIRRKFILDLGEALKTIADSNHLDEKLRRKMLIQSGTQLIKLFGAKQIASVSWFRDGDNFISEFICQSEPHIYIEQNVKGNYITVSNSEQYIELFDEIFKENKKAK